MKVGILTSSVWVISFSTILATTSISPAQQPPIPKMSVTWDSGGGVNTIAIIDECTFEKGFRVYRSDNRGAFKVITDLPETIPSYRETKRVIDREVVPNCWYTYRVEAYTDSFNVFSNDTTLFTYKVPPATLGYSFSRIAELPIQPASWAKQFGDSVYVLTTVPNSEDAMVAIIDVSDDAHPVLAETLPIDELLARMANTPIGLYFRYGTTDNTIWWEGRTCSNGEYLFTFNNNDTLKQIKLSTGTVIDDLVIQPEMPTSGITGIIGFLNDSLILITATAYANSPSQYRLYLCVFNTEGMDTISSWPIGVRQNGGVYGDLHQFGFSAGKVYFSTYSKHSTSTLFFSQYHIFDFSTDHHTPLHFQIQIPFDRYESSVGMLDSTTFLWYNQFVEQPLSLSCSDVRDLYAKPLSVYVDSLLQGNQVSTIILDSINHRLFIVAVSTFIVYHYTQPVKVVRQPRLNTKGHLTTRSVRGGIFISMDNSTEPVECLFILDPAGRVLRKFQYTRMHQSTDLFWDGKNSAGDRLANGTYVIVGKKKSTTESARAFLYR